VGHADGYIQVTEVVIAHVVNPLTRRSDRCPTNRPVQTRSAWILKMVR
jgi:hypothetical protein